MNTKLKTKKYDWVASDANLGEYDIRSIMHYDGTLRGLVRDPIIVDKLTGKGIEINRKMSPLDIQKLNEMYPCKPTGPVFGMFNFLADYHLCHIDYA